MEHKIPWELLERIFSGKALKKEEAAFEYWLLQAPENEMITNQLRNYYSENGSLPIIFNPDKEIALNLIKTKIGLCTPDKGKLVTINSIWWKVAATILILVSCWWLLPKGTISNFAATKILTTDTTRTDIILADGTHVWLNNATEISYPGNFKTNREVYLKGEAYFEVAHDTLHPFVISTGNTQIRVLGTKFNVHSISTDSIDNVIVLEGKVSYVNKKNCLVLSVGDQGIFNKNSGILIKSVNNNPNYLSWKTNELIFQDVTLESVFSDLSKVYRFKYEIKDAELKNRKFTAQFHQISLPNILESISIAANCAITKINQTYIIQ